MLVNLLSKHLMHDEKASIDVAEIHFYRYWDAASETYAGGDSLATAFHLGWKSADQVLLKEHWRSGKRCVKVYYFELHYGEVSLIMPVIANPFVEKVIVDTELQVMKLVNTMGIEKSPSKVPSRLHK